MHELLQYKIFESTLTPLFDQTVMIVKVPFLLVIQMAAAQDTNLNLWKLSRLLADHERCIEWCKEHNLLSSSMKCPKPECGNALKWQRRTASGDGFVWRCSRKNCNGQASIRQKSWFFGGKLSLEKTLALTYAWAHKFTTTQAVHETALDEETTLTETVIDW